MKSQIFSDKKFKNTQKPYKKVFSTSCEMSEIIQHDDGSKDNRNVGQTLRNEIKSNDLRKARGDNGKAQAFKSRKNQSEINFS